MKTLSPEKYVVNLSEHKPKGTLPLDGSTLTTRIAVDYMNLSDLVAAMTAALMVEKPYVATKVIDADRDLWYGATSSSFNMPEERLKLLTLLETLCYHLDTYNYRFEIVRTVPRHR